MKYATIKDNDIANGPGVGVSVFLQGCERHCPGCFNPETWDFDGGQEFTQDTLKHILNALTAHGIKRHLSILGGEPLHPNNLFLTQLIISTVKQELPETKIYIWTGYTIEELRKSTSKALQYILSTADVLIDGPYIDSERDITLPMRGSRNQRIIPLK